MAELMGTYEEPLLICQGNLLWKEKRNPAYGVPRGAPEEAKKLCTPIA